LFYDRAGDRTGRILDGVEEWYFYDQRNRMTGQSVNGREEYYTYDNAGNLLRDGRASYTYDAFNRQTKAEMFDGNIQINHYDPEGLRYEMEENERLVQFIFRDKEVIAEESEAGMVRYIRTHELLASDAESARTYYHYASDEMGSITHVTGGEEVLNRYGYDAWGNIIDREETVENRFCFAGEQYDSVSQQYYLRARFYNPVIGRFTQEDTYRGDGLNLYAYCRNKPVYYVDPSGHFCLSMAEKILAAISEGTVAGNDLEKLKKYLAEKKKLNDGEKRVAEKLGIENKGKIDFRYEKGIVTGGDKLNDVDKMMRGTQGNIGIIPKEIGEKLNGRTFNNFDEFREALWREIGNSKYTNEFSNANITRMKEGLAPKVMHSQMYGKLASYIIHHKKPIHDGGGVYDLSNLLISTPRMHQEILDKTYHFGN
jgi:RHS repeat-associated protein